VVIACWELQALIALPIWEAQVHFMVLISDEARSRYILAGQPKARTINETAVILHGSGEIHALRSSKM
jgi:hypothetical protein